MAIVHLALNDNMGLELRRGLSARPRNGLGTYDSHHSDEGLSSE